MYTNYNVEFRSSSPSEPDAGAGWRSGDFRTAVDLLSCSSGKSNKVALRRRTPDNRSEGRFTVYGWGDDGELMLVIDGAPSADSGDHVIDGIMVHEVLASDLAMGGKAAGIVGGGAATAWVRGGTYLLQDIAGTVVRSGRTIDFVRRQGSAYAIRAWQNFNSRQYIILIYILSSEVWSKCFVASIIRP